MKKTVFPIITAFVCTSIVISLIMKNRKKIIDY